jgi:hypothetical protein
MSSALAPPKVKKAKRETRMDVALFERKRLAAGLSIEAVASKIGTGRNTPGRWVGGVEPLLIQAQRLANLLEVSVNDLWPPRVAKR